MLDQLRGNKTIIALLFASLSILYTYIELKTEVNTTRTAVGHYLRNFTFSFIIVYSSLLIYKKSKKLNLLEPVVNNIVKQAHIMTGRPNF